MKMTLKYIASDVDAQGNVRHYVRKAGRPKIRLRARPGTVDFMLEYERALSGVDARQVKPKPARERADEYTLGWLVDKYVTSSKFTMRVERNQRTDRAVLDAVIDERISATNPKKFGSCPLSRVDPAMIRLLRDRKLKLPPVDAKDRKPTNQGAANKRLDQLKAMFAWAMENVDPKASGLKANPAYEVKPVAYKAKPFTPWKPADVAKFLAVHKPGSKPALALGLLLFTGTRRSDVVKLGPSIVRDDCFVFTPTKTSETTATELVLPIVEPLQTIIDASPHGKVTYLVTEKLRRLKSGDRVEKAFSAASFGNWFRDRCDEAGLPHLSCHGVRKTGAENAAENGATEQQMMAIFGWTSPRMAAYYAKNANQKRLAAGAMHMLIPAG